MVVIPGPLPLFILRATESWVGTRPGTTTLYTRAASLMTCNRVRRTKKIEVKWRSPRVRHVYGKKFSALPLRQSINRNKYNASKSSQNVMANIVDSAWRVTFVSPWCPQNTIFAQTVQRKHSRSPFTAWYSKRPLLFPNLLKLTLVSSCTTALSQPGNAFQMKGASTKKK